MRDCAILAGPIEFSIGRLNMVVAFDRVIEGENYLETVKGICCPCICFYV